MVVRLVVRVRVYTERIRVKVTPEMYAGLRFLAAMLNTNVAALVREFIAEKLREHAQLFEEQNGDGVELSAGASDRELEERVLGIILMLPRTNRKLLLELLGRAYGVTEHRLARILSRLEAQGVIRCVREDGGFYIYPRIKLNGRNGNGHAPRVRVVEEVVA